MLTQTTSYRRSNTYKIAHRACTPLGGFLHAQGTQYPRSKVQPYPPPTAEVRSP